MLFTQPVDYKVAIIGPSNSGKSDIILSFLGIEYQEGRGPTCGASFYISRPEIEGKSLSIRLFEIGDIPAMRSMLRSYITDADAVILVYDRTNYDSFISVKSYFEDASIICQKGMFMIIGNKSDLPPDIRVDEVRQFANENFMLYAETSAKTGAGISNAYETLIKELIQRSEPLI